MDQASVAINHGHPAAEPAHGLSELEADKSPTQDEEMLWRAFEFQCFNVRQGLCFEQARSSVDRCMGSGVDDHMFPMQKTDAIIRGFDLDCFWRHKTPRTHDQLGAAFVVKVEMHVYQASDHLALAFNHGRHVGFRVVSIDSEFLASPEIRNNLRAMNDAFARQAGD